MLLLSPVLAKAMHKTWFSRPDVALVSRRPATVLP